MSYQVLARKWRPKRFEDVVGQEHVVKVLTNALNMSRIHHAYLFSGTRGVGKTSIARLLAKGLNCENGVTAEPCGVCQNCVGIEQGHFIDLLEIDAASRTKVEDTREILDNIQYSPTRGRFKVYLIDEVHMLSKSSFNALLKTLEEPPEYVKFILATTDPQKLPVTILSRCLQLHLRALSIDVIQHQLDHILKLEQIKFDSSALFELAKAANGSMRDGLSLTDQAIAAGNGTVNEQDVKSMLGLLDQTVVFSLIKSLINNDGNQLLAHLKHAYEQGADWETLLNDSLTWLYQISLHQVLPHAIAEDNQYEQECKSLAQLMKPEDVQLCYQILLNAKKDIAYAPDKKLGVEMAFLRALSFIPFDKTIDAENSTKVNDSSVQNQEKKQKNISSVLNSVTQLGHPSAEQYNNSVHAKNEEQTISEQEIVSDDPKAMELSFTDAILKARESLENQVSEQKKIIPEAKSEPAKTTLAANVLNAKLNDIANEVTTETLAKIDVETELETDVENEEEIDISNEEQQAQLIKENYQWQYSDEKFNESSPVINLNDIIQLETSDNVINKINLKVMEIDEWSREVEALNFTPILKQIALNSFKTWNNETLTLNLRKEFVHLLNSNDPISRIKKIIQTHYNKQIQLEIIENDDQGQLTPNEFRKKIYNELLNESVKTIHDDDKVKMLCDFFNAAIDEESIRPV